MKTLLPTDPLTVLVGDCREMLGGLADKSIQTCVTSPPYFGLRDYGTGSWTGGDPACDHVVGQLRRGLGLAQSTASVRGGGKKAARVNLIQARSLCPKCGAVRTDRQIGREETPEAYIEALVGVFREVRRTLRDDGTVFLNLGDRYASDLSNRETRLRTDRDLELPVWWQETVPAPASHTLALASTWIGRVQADLAPLAVGREKPQSRGPGTKAAPLRGMPALLAAAESALAASAELAICLPGLPSGALPPALAVCRPAESLAAYCWSLESLAVLARRCMDSKTFSEERFAEAAPGVAAACATVLAWLGYAPPPVGSFADRLRSKDLLGLPWRVAFALQADGWVLRQEVIWQKANASPEPCTDRCTRAHEPVFMLAKSERYYFDHKAIREPAASGGEQRAQYRRAQEIAREKGLTPAHFAAIRAAGLSDAGKNRVTQTGTGKNTPEVLRLAQEAKDALGGYYREFLLDRDGLRNKRSVWKIATKPFAGGHFAPFPPDLVRPCVLAGSRPGDAVLDPFGGSGTTAAVALELGRRAVLIELNPEYRKFIDARTVDATQLPFGETGEAGRPETVSA